MGTRNTPVLRAIIEMLGSYHHVRPGPAREVDRDAHDHRLEAHHPAHPGSHRNGCHGHEWAGAQGVHFLQTLTMEALEMCLEGFHF